MDAEQQVYQPTIDRWAVDLMRKYNRNGDALILNTYQAYLKSTRQTLHSHLQLAQQEGWTLGMKLVRGAYIASDKRGGIHDTKAATDECYNSIVHDLLSRRFDSVRSPDFPTFRLLAAGHNAESIQRATALHGTLTLAGHKPPAIEFAQLLGMADHISGELLAQAEVRKTAGEGLTAAQREMQGASMPRVVKCANWGTVRECLHFLMRRWVENQGAAERLRDGLVESRRELWARCKGVVGLR